MVLPLSVGAEEKKLQNGPLTSEDLQKRRKVETAPARESITPRRALAIASQRVSGPVLEGRLTLIAQYSLP
jgi:hypothetical protein